MCGRISEGPVYGVLGNHDTIRMVPGLEDMGIRMLLNECRGSWRAAINASTWPASTTLITTGWTISKKRADSCPRRSSRSLLSHTPEIYRQAAHAGFKLLLSGHTHGGQICLPGVDPDYARFGAAEAYGRRVREISRHDRLYLGRRRIMHRSGADQLPAGNHAASFAASLR